MFSFVLSLLPAQKVDAQAPITIQEQEDGAVVCAPGVYLTDPGNCAPLGPSQTLSEMAQWGISYPASKLLAVTPDPALNYLPYRYFKITEKFTHTYGSLDAAIEKTSPLRQIGPGHLIYVTYNQVEETNRGTYFLLPSGEWMPGAGTRVSVPVFQGMQFLTTPKNGFGWVLQEAEVRRMPDYGYGVEIARKMPRFTIVQVYSVITVEGTRWFLIGPDEWVDGRFIGAVFPNTTPPAGVTNGRWIDVNLQEQTMAVYDNYKLVFATLIASGLDPFWTRPGLFQIYKKKELEDMSGAFEADRSDYYFLQNVPNTMYFDKARAIHGAYWRAMFGYPQSHGCVNMSVGDSAWVFQWAKEGDWVYVHDPSGITPSDPEIYGDGGA